MGSFFVANTSIDKFSAKALIIDDRRDVVLTGKIGYDPVLSIHISADMARALIASLSEAVNAIEPAEVPA